MLEVNFDPFPELTTENLLLRKIKETDTENLFRLRADKEVMKYIGKIPLETLQQAGEFIAMINDRIDNNLGINWAITLKARPHDLIGVIGLWRIIKEHYRAEIGYMLLPEFWRKGFTKEAIKSVLAFGFNEMQLHSIEAHINPLNIISAKTLESAGFIREAYFREDFFFNGKFEDTAIYSKLNK